MLSISSVMCAKEKCDEYLLCNNVQCTYLPNIIEIYFKTSFIFLLRSEFKIHGCHDANNCYKTCANN